MLNETEQVTKILELMAKLPSNEKEWIEICHKIQSYPRKEMQQILDGLTKTECEIIEAIFGIDRKNTFTFEEITWWHKTMPNPVTPIKQKEEG